MTEAIRCTLCDGAGEYEASTETATRCPGTSETVACSRCRGSGYEPCDCCRTAGATVIVDGYPYCPKCDAELAEPTVRTVWQVWDTGSQDYIFASYEERAAGDFARVSNSAVPMPGWFMVERCHLVAGAVT
jgi:hypothetical protein